MNLYEVSGTLHDDTKFGRASYEVKTFVLAENEDEARELFQQNIEPGHGISLMRSVCLATTNIDECVLRNFRRLIIKEEE